MPSSPLSRRRFLRGSLGVGLGAGAAALGVPDLSGPAWSAAAFRQRRAAGLIAAPEEPAAQLSFVSRPDITPPGVTIVTTEDIAAIAGQPQYIFLTPRAKLETSQPPETQGLMILDLAGDLVWWKPVADTQAIPFNLRVQTYQGEPVLTWYEGYTGTGFGERGSAFVADDTYGTIATVSTDLYSGLDLHEFLITPLDTALCTSYELTGGGPVYGHALEMPIPSGPGTPAIFDWSSQDQVPTSLSYVTTPDYFHINSIDLWPGTARNLLISSKNTWCVYLVDRQTKEIIWRVGGKDSSFTRGPGCAFEWAHDARPLVDGSGFSLFDNASDPAPETQSWGKVFNVDQTTMQVTLRHEFNHPNVPLRSISQGNNQLLPTGGHLVGWGPASYFTLFGPSGSKIRPHAILDGRLPDNIGYYRAFMDDWVGRPPESEMALVVRPGPGAGTFSAYMSWNGATEIDSWRINAGTSTHQVDLPTIQRKKKNGFQTIIPFTRDGATEFQAVALDVNGVVLGRTAIVQATGN